VGSNKPRGAPGIHSLKRRWEQRTRRWSKASRSRLRATQRETAAVSDEQSSAHGTGEKDEEARFAV